MEENDNPIMDFIVPALGIICLIALAVQTWFFIDWLMGPADWWMKYFTLCFFDIFGGIWIALGLFHVPPSKATYQMQKTGVVVCFLLSASTTVAWCFIFITRSPLTPSAIASMVDTARWLVVIAVIFNAFLMIFYAAKTSEYQQRVKNPHKKRWATEKPLHPQTRTVARRPAPTRVRVAQVATTTPRRVEQLPASVEEEELYEEGETELNDSEEEEDDSSDEEIEEEEEPDNVPLLQRVAAAKQALLPRKRNQKRN
jgi:hypothetical protein